MESLTLQKQSVTESFLAAALGGVCQLECLHETQ